MFAGAFFAGGCFIFCWVTRSFAPLDQRGVLVALFFALTFTAGHLNHEVGDFDSDRPNGLKTNAVAFGKQRVFVAGLTVFTLAYVWLLLLARSELIPRSLALLPLLLFRSTSFGQSARFEKGLTRIASVGSRFGYRLLYGIIGLGMLFTLFGWGVLSTIREPRQAEFGVAFPDRR